MVNEGVGVCVGVCWATEKEEERLKRGAAQLINVLLCSEHGYLECVIWKGTRMAGIAGWEQGHIYQTKNVVILYYNMHY